MINYLKYRWRLRSLINKKKNLKSIYDSEIREARKKDLSDLEIAKIESDAFFEDKFIREEMSVLLTKWYSHKAAKLILPLPELNDKEMWYEGQYVSPRKLLTNKGIAKLRSDIRDERKWIRKDLITFIGLLISLAAAVFAYRQSDIAEQSMKYAIRPYVVLSGIKAHSNNRWRFSVSNFGMSPSYHTKIYYGTFISDSSFVPPSSFSKINDLVPVIGANTRGALTKADIAHVFHYDTLQVLEKKNKFSFVAGKVEYIDIFNEKHGYFFCFIKTTDPGVYKFKDYNYAY